MISKLSSLFNEFMENEQASGLVLIACTVLSIAVANSRFGESYLDFWNVKVGIDTFGVYLKHSIGHWINDGLMAVFFLLIGLEIERELYIGELSDLKNAALPIFAAIGGMATPALFHFLINHGTETQSGIGIPMATDIAFALGVLALLGKNVPSSLKVFLTALAIIDDLGAIVIIAVFYVSTFSLASLAISLAIFALLLFFNRAGVKNLFFYLIPGCFMWYFMMKSGVHATIAGVLLAFAIPFEKGGENSPSTRLQHALHKPVAFLVMPLFALANTGIVFFHGWTAGLASPNTLGIFSGLFLGKPLGIVLFCLAGIKLGAARLPEDLKFSHITGAGFLGGIGFTMSIFITLLAFGDAGVIQDSKIGILVSSLASGVMGFMILKLATKVRS
jgi:NhaA family Na+:H+ antiporter